MTIELTPEKGHPVPMPWIEEVYSTGTIGIERASLTTIHASFKKNNIFLQIMAIEEVHKRVLKIPLISKMFQNSRY